MSRLYRPLPLFIVAIGFMFSRPVVGLMGGDQKVSDDPYENYIKTSQDFKRVRQDRDWLISAWPTWIYMPWYYKWNIGFTDEAGKFSKKMGYNGAFIDNGNTKYLDWINKFGLRFYMDHTASKGYLYIRHSNKQSTKELNKRKVRDPALNSTLVSKLHSIIRGNIKNLKKSPYRTAYALDDEISWGSFVKPIMWCVTDDSSAFRKWLKEIYGRKYPKYRGWISYNDIRKKLDKWRLKDFDCGQLMDQLTFNDATWANFLGELVKYANSVDPDIPCGFVGGQSPNAFGGYDYARLLRKIQFIEAYNIAESQAVIRSFNPHNAIPTVTTHFHRNVKDTIWQAWFYMARGNRGHIGWVEGWFDGKKPKPFHQALAPSFHELAEKIGPLQVGSEWIHDGVAIYYSHPSIQMSWILDAEPHGGTWPNRNGDDRLGTSHLCRKAWVNMLRDEGIQFSFLSYVDLVQNDGVPEEYKVLILPACYCLSDIEAKRIREFAERGGTVIADFLPGVFDQHGRGRKKGGALDDLFGVKHDPNMKKKDVFQTNLWVETDQESNFGYKSYEQFLGKHTDCIKDDSGFDKAVRKMGVMFLNRVGKGAAVLMNLSPQWYNAYRVQGFEPAKKRDVFMCYVRAGGALPWVRIENADSRTFGYEITYWKKGNRTLLFVVMNPETKVSSTGGGNSVSLKQDTVKLALKFTGTVRKVKNERTGETLPDSDTISVSWKMNEAIVLSFTGTPPRPAATEPFPASAAPPNAEGTNENKGGAGSTGDDNSSKKEKPPAGEAGDGVNAGHNSTGESAAALALDAVVGTPVAITETAAPEPAAVKQENAEPPVLTAIPAAAGKPLSDRALLTADNTPAYIEPPPDMAKVSAALQDVRNTLMNTKQPSRRFVTSTPPPVSSVPPTALTNKPVVSRPTLILMAVAILVVLVSLVILKFLLWGSSAATEMESSIQNAN